MTKDPNNDKDYKVGYGKPPKHSRWRKGQSGNPKGAPTRKAEVDSLSELRALFWKAAMTPVTTMVDGKRMKIPALQATYLKLFARTIDGHEPSIRLAHTLANQTMTEHIDWQVMYYQEAQRLIEEIRSQPDDKKDETMRLIHALMKKLDMKITD